MPPLIGAAIAAAVPSLGAVSISVLGTAIPLVNVLGARCLSGLRGSLSLLIRGS